MSVTVSDLMKLPSLRQATVLGGHNGLTKTVSSISVLESADPAYLVDGVFPQGEFFGSEIVITGFLNIPYDVESQCANIRRLAEGGEVGLILFYVGVYLPAVDQRLIDLANELDFVLICMPPGEKLLRYGEVMSDVMDCICRDRMRNDSIVTDILARMSNLPRHLQSINTVLKMLSDRISATTLLCSTSGEILNLAAWPRSIEPVIKSSMNQGIPFPEGVSPCPFLQDGWIYRLAIRISPGQEYILLLVKEVSELNKAQVDQAEEVVRLCISIWGRGYDEIAIHELVRAIIQDEPIKMRRLAEIFSVDVASIHEMWIVQGQNEETVRRLTEYTGQIRELLKGQMEAYMLDIYEGKLLLFMNTPASLRIVHQITDAILSPFQDDPSVTLTRCPGLRNTTEVRNAYLAQQAYLADVKKIYPLRSRFTLGEVRFAAECRKLVEAGEQAATECLSQLTRLQTDKAELFTPETLGAFLLDCEGSMTRTAARLHLHINTVKYRIARISDALGFRPDKLPEGYAVFRAVAVYRLIS